MKKPEEYTILNMEFKLIIDYLSKVHPRVRINLLLEEIHNLIRQAQEDAIKETLNKVNFK